MTKEELAAELNGREYGNVFTKCLKQAAKDAGLVIVCGASDDLMEFDGAIYDEAGVYNGGVIAFDKDGPLGSWENVRDEINVEDAKAFFKRMDGAKTIEALWGLNNISWQYKTDIPHVSFDIMEDDEVYCRGIVFNLSDLSK